MREKYKPKEHVNTELGEGVVVSPEAEEGFLASRYLVKLLSINLCSDTTKELHKRYGGLYFTYNEISPVD